MIIICHLGDSAPRSANSNNFCNFQFQTLPLKQLIRNGDKSTNRKQLEQKLKIEIFNS